MKKAFSFILALCLLAVMLPSGAAKTAGTEEKRLLGERHWAVKLYIAEHSLPETLRAVHGPEDFGADVERAVSLAPSTVTRADDIYLLQTWLEKARAGTLPPVDAPDPQAAERNEALLHVLESGYADEWIIQPKGDGGREAAEALCERLRKVSQARLAAAGAVVYSDGGAPEGASLSYGDMLPGLIPEYVNVVSFAPEEPLHAGEYALQMIVRKPAYDLFAYTEADLGLPEGAVKRIVPAYAQDSSRFHTLYYVFLNDTSLAAAQAVQKSAAAAEPVDGAKVVPYADAEIALAEGYMLMVNVDTAFWLSQTDLGQLGGDAAAYAEELYPEKEAQRCWIHLYLKDPGPETAAKTAHALRGQPHVHYVEYNGAVFLDDYLIGDADMDGYVTAADARLILRFAVLLETPRYAYAAWVADTDFSRRIDAADARYALRVAVGLEREMHVS